MQAIEIRSGCEVSVGRRLGLCGIYRQVSAAAKEGAKLRLLLLPGRLGLGDPLHAVDARSCLTGYARLMSGDIFSFCGAQI